MPAQVDVCVSVCVCVCAMSCTCSSYAHTGTLMGLCFQVQCTSSGPSASYTVKVSGNKAGSAACTAAGQTITFTGFQVCVNALAHLHRCWNARMHGFFDRLTVCLL